MIFVFRSYLWLLNKNASSINERGHFAVRCSLLLPCLASQQAQHSNEQEPSPKPRLFSPEELSSASDHAPGRAESSDTKRVGSPEARTQRHLKTSSEEYEE